MEMKAIARQVRKLNPIGGDWHGFENKALAQIARSLLDRQSEIVRANQEDLTRSAKENLPAPL